MKFQESETIELKRTLNKDFAKEVVAFLNTQKGSLCSMRHRRSLWTWRP